MSKEDTVDAYKVPFYGESISKKESKLIIDSTPTAIFIERSF